MRAVRRPESFYPSSFTRFSFFSLRGKNANHWVATSSQIVNCLNESGFPSRESFSCLLHFLRCIRRLNFKQVKKISVHFCWFFFFKKKKLLIRRTSLIPPSSMRLFFSPVDSNSHGKAGALLRQPWPRTLYCRESERPVSLIPFRLSSVTAVKASSRSRVHLFFFF